jgi:hypothetical protein|tara:strand:- start:2769 stop:2966 length:198 start_codon:yes stop_codon:yes gene_type:complete
MKNTITIFDAHAVVYGPDDFGSKTIVNLLEIGVLKLSKKSVEGKTGADIGWTAYKDAVITEDYRD